MKQKAPKLLDRVRDTLHRHDMLDAGDPCLAAVSGGADSMCLVQVFHELRIPFEIAHFDHGTRAGESAKDAAFVREAAARYGVPCLETRRDIPREAAQSRESFEEVARQARYAFLLETAAARGCPALATGHHADDQAETVLLRLLRGTSPGGLGAIPPLRQAGDVRIIRPLLDCTRDEILAYLDARGVPFCIDRTNVDTRHPRNHVRHELLPFLARHYNPRVRDALRRLAELQRDEDDFLQGLATDLADAWRTGEHTIDRQTFAMMHPALQRRVVALLGWEFGIECPANRIEIIRRHLLEGPTGKACDLGQGILLRNAREVTEIVKEPVHPEERVVTLAFPGETVAFGRRYTVRKLEKPPTEELAAYCTPARQVFDAESLGTVLAVRFRRPGDRFRPLGLGGSKKLKDYFIDLGLTERERARQPLLTAQGTIVWVIGRATGQCAAVTPSTRRYVEIRVENATP
ncbi:MAG: tRNA lysidine(34) synthetase TilS [Candidatus Hydrogenedentales bacterium]